MPESTPTPHAHKSSRRLLRSAVLVPFLFKQPAYYSFQIPAAQMLSHLFHLEQNSYLEGNIPLDILQQWLGEYEIVGRTEPCSKWGGVGWGGGVWPACSPARLQSNGSDQSPVTATRGKSALTARAYVHFTSECRFVLPSGCMYWVFASLAPKVDWLLCSEGPGWFTGPMSSSVSCAGSPSDFCLSGPPGSMTSEVFQDVSTIQRSLTNKSARTQLKLGGGFKTTRHSLLPAFSVFSKEYLPALLTQVWRTN